MPAAVRVAAAPRAVAGVLAAALAAWLLALRGTSMMGGLAPFLGAWTTSMAAMMLPSAAPMVAAYAALGRGRGSPTAFVAGYLALWIAAGLVVYWLGLALPDQGWLAGAALVLAGLYQLTPLKDACLRRCRAPLGFVTTRWREGVAGAAAMGVEHGAWCAGCCGGLMVALLALGMSSLAWMAVVALLILGEKALPGGERLARASGVLLVAAGAVALA